MTSNASSGSGARRVSRQLDRDDGDIYTINGYIKVFGDCQNTSDVFSGLANLVDDIGFDAWKKFLEEKRKYELVEQLFQYWKEKCARLQPKDKSDLIKFVELFSLAENVLRNTLLRPYIPAYRTINMNCGRYAASVSRSGEKLLRVLNFDEISGNLLTYQGQDPTLTILYALTCSVFWHILSMELKKTTFNT